MAIKKWTSFTKRIVVDTPRRTLYQAFATQLGLESWFLRTALYYGVDGSRIPDSALAHAGCSYRWNWFGWDDSVTQTGNILAANGYNQIDFTFHSPMIVTVQISEAKKGSIVELTQKNIPTDDESKTNFFVGCGEGWTFYLTNLKSVLEGGLDLRNKEPQVKRVVNS